MKMIVKLAGTVRRGLFVYMPWVTGPNKVLPTEFNTFVYLVLHCVNLAVDFFFLIFVVFSCLDII